MEVYFDILDNKMWQSYADLEQQIINYLLKLEDGITLIEITEFVRTVIKMNSFEQDRNIYIPIYKGNNKFTELQTILQRESQNS